MKTKLTKLQELHCVEQSPEIQAAVRLIIGYMETRKYRNVMLTYDVTNKKTGKIDSYVLQCLKFHVLKPKEPQTQNSK
jgi:hypothetical protein